MARYHIINRWRDGQILELMACPDCTADNCRDAVVHAFTDGELEQHDAEVWDEGRNYEYAHPRP